MGGRERRKGQEEGRGEKGRKEVKNGRKENEGKRGREKGGKDKRKEKETEGGRGRGREGSSYTHQLSNGPELRVMAVNDVRTRTRQTTSRIQRERSRHFTQLLT